jgi:septal ring-binding cell division protein DamX
MDNETNQPGANQPAHGRRVLGGLGRRAALAATAIGLMTGAFAGGFIVTHAATSTAATSTAATSTATPSATTTTPSTPSGTFHSNETASHEAGESAAREAQETAGQFPTVP